MWRRRVAHGHAGGAGCLHPLAAKAVSSNMHNMPPHMAGVKPSLKNSSSHPQVLLLAPFMTNKLENRASCLSCQVSPTTQSA